MAGPAGEGELDALIISKESIKGGEYVNNIRKERGLAETKFLIIDLIMEQSN